MNPKESWSVEIAGKSYRFTLTEEDDIFTLTVHQGGRYVEEVWFRTRGDVQPFIHEFIKGREVRYASHD